MQTSATPTSASRRVTRARRGSALMLTMIFTLALGGLAISAIYMGSSTTILTKLYDRERDYRYAAEWALAIGKSRVTEDSTLVLPDSLYLQLMNGQVVTDAGGQQVPKVLVDLYVGPGGNSTGQYGRFVELVAVAYDNGGARHVRRLELQAENFARYAMFVDTWATGACYTTGEILRGRSHSNQNWKNCGSAPGVIHTDTVSAVGTVNGTGQYQSAKINAHPVIRFPSVARLSWMPGYASSASLSLTPAAYVGTTGGSRLEFTAVDLDGDGALTGAAEGYFRVFDGRSGGTNNPWANGSAVAPFVSGGTDTTLLRMSTPSGTTFQAYVGGGTSLQKSAINNQCGLWVPMGNPARQTFVPLAAFDTVDVRYKWLADTLSAIPTALIPSRIHAGNLVGAKRFMDSVWRYSARKAQVMRVQTAPATSTGRCYPAGDPRLMPTERPGLLRAFPAAANQSIDTLPDASKRGGEDTTFTAVTKTGTWRAWPGYSSSFFTAGVTRRQLIEEPRLWPVHRTQNLTSKGVIYVNGDIFLSGTFRGRATLYISGSGTFIDDLTYVTNPASLPICQNLLGIITGNNLMIANNNLNRPRTMDGSGAPTVFLDDNQDFHLHAVTLSGVSNTNATFGVESFNSGPSAGRQCTPVAGYTVVTSGGCIAQAGGVILRAISATFSGSNTGFAENRVKDACLDVDSPPYFPLTGRYLDNEFYELDPAVFNTMGVAQFFRRLQSAP
ncbi:MAG: hypothetical protein IT361_14800 [Gemmatimonadaceae bacterium]|nr:hypothetical protein [Gemmatimonadaceae bacterium]